MKFSVVIPVYNSIFFLKRCIDSLLNQAYEEYELILVDDGSTDGSYEMCMKYAEMDRKIMVFRQDNSGPSIARNNGMNKASGDYLLFVDSDDWVEENYFSVLSKAIKSNPDMVLFGINHPRDIACPDKIFPEKELHGTEKIVDYLSQNYSSVDVHSCVNKAYSKRLYQNTSLQFPINTVVEEDLLFVLRAVGLSDSAKSVPEVLYHYNQRSNGSITTKYNPDKFDCKVRAYEEEMKFAQYWGDLKLKTAFQENYLLYISACINNLMYEDCRLTTKHKIAEIRRFYQKKSTHDCARQCMPCSMRGKIMCLLIRGKMYRVSYLIHAMGIHIVRRNKS